MGGRWAGAEASAQADARPQALPLRFQPPGSGTRAHTGQWYNLGSSLAAGAASAHGRARSVSRFLDARRETLPTAVTDLAEQLAEAGYKVTGPRLAVLKAATAHQGAFSVQELEQWLIIRGESPGIASIFRTVRLLCDLNLLQRIHGLDECHRYSLGVGHGHHLVCTRCGAMERFDNCGMQSIVELLEQRTGFRINAHLVELFGLCPRCLAAAYIA